MGIAYDTSARRYLRGILGATTILHGYLNRQFDPLREERINQAIDNLMHIGTS